LVGAGVAGGKPANIGPAAEQVCGNGEIKEFGKICFSVLLPFMRPEAEHPNLPCPVMKVIPSISNFSLNGP
jgi:hypothetical protein